MSEVVDYFQSHGITFIENHMGPVTNWTYSWDVKWKNATWREVLSNNYIRSNTLYYHPVENKFYMIYNPKYKPRTKEQQTMKILFREPGCVWYSEYDANPDSYYQSEFQMGPLKYDRKLHMVLAGKFSDIEPYLVW